MSFFGFSPSLRPRPALKRRRKSSSRSTLVSNAPIEVVVAAVAAAVVTEATGATGDLAVVVVVVEGDADAVQTAETAGPVPTAPQSST